MPFSRALFWLILIAAGVAAIAYAGSRPARVAVLRPRASVVTETIAASGEVRGQVETNVGARVSGRVAVLLVRSGNRVRTGQVIARIDDTVLRAEVDRAQEALRTAEIGVTQASDAVRSARAQVELAARRPLDSDIARTKAEAAQNSAVAEARVAAAKQRLAELERGATPEQRQQIAAQVEQAEVALRKAERDRERQKRLLDAGAVAQVTLEDAETARDTARKALENVRARQLEIENGTRPEQIAQASAELRAAEATLAGAQATGEAQIRSILALPRPEDVAVARTRLAEAQGSLEAARARGREAQLALDVARQRLEETVVTVPFDGTITGIATEAGAITGPSQPIVKLVRTGRPEIRVAIDEDNLGRLRVGQSAIVTAEAFPGERVSARVREIGAEVNTTRGQVEVKLDPEKTPAWLRPGQTLTVNLIVDRGSRRLLVPASALTTAGNIPQLLVVEQGIVRKKQVEIGGAGPEGIVIRSGLAPDALVVREPSTARPGQRVEVRQSDVL